KPPYPGTHGLWVNPTVINNVATFALATSIVKQGAKWWQAQGREGFSGLKFVSISGDVEQPGVYEVPMGTSVAELISLAGGMRGGAQLKAFLPGGASSNFLSAQYVDTPLDFKAMQDAGSMMGTGALIVMAEDRNLYELATNLVQFFRNESCGKCGPCRIGSEKAVGILQAVQSGEGSRDALQILPDLGETLEQTSICGLGQVALNPILSMLKHFPEELPA
ncbi:MAG: SLBB domain-containing protein, partial [Pirellulales bacterium]|nr:SLBB domain-containing protein [Pirellulales bacterium]